MSFTSRAPRAWCVSDSFSAWIRDSLTRAVRCVFNACLRGSPPSTTTASLTQASGGRWNRMAVRGFPCCEGGETPYIYGTDVDLAGVGIRDAYVLCVEVLFDAFRTAFSAQAGLLNPAEWSGGAGDDSCVQA